MVFSVKGRVALVTGGTEVRTIRARRTLWPNNDLPTCLPKGIGLAVVERLLDEGARVIIANRNVQLAEKVVPELRAKRGLSEKQVSFVRMVDYEAGRKGSRC